jgi:hypothetical protein
MIYETQLIRTIELHNLCFCPDIIRLMKQRSMAWAGVRGTHGRWGRCTDLKISVKYSEGKRGIECV